MAIKLKNSNIGGIMAAAMKSGDDSEIAGAWERFHESLAEQLEDDFNEVKRTNDSAVLAQRGYRQLTAGETKWYQRLADVMKSDNPQQKFSDVIGADAEDGVMPETIIEDVYRDLVAEHDLLSKITFTYVKYATKWILNDHTKQKAVWGKITDSITKEITSGFKIVAVNQHKLSAYAFIERGMLDLGPTFLDAYIRTVLAEALRCGLEQGAVSGNGLNGPVGMDRDIHNGVSFSTSTGYPKKAAVKVKSFSPSEYGKLVAKVSKTESGAMRKFDHVDIVCNMEDYLTKIMPATTTLNAVGEYKRDLFPFPTEVSISNEVSTGEAIIGLLGEYSMFAGGEQNGVIEFSDEFKFLDDARYFKIKQYGDGRPFDDTSFVLLDISELDPAFITVRTDSAAAAAASLLEA